MTSTTKRLSLLKNYVGPCHMNTWVVWGLSLGLPSRKAWLSFQMNKQSGLNGTPLPDGTPLGIKPQATVSPPLMLVILTRTYAHSVRGNTTGPSQSTTQKATNPSVAADTVKADVPTEQPDQDFGKGYPETLTSGDISAAKQAVGNIKPGMSENPSSSPTIV